MKVSDAKKLLTSVIEYNIEQATKPNASISSFVVPMFIGDPGVGKTDIPKQVSRDLGITYKQAIIAQFDAGELAGLPWMDQYSVPQIGEDGEVVHDKEGNVVMVERRRMIRLRPDYLPNPEIEEETVGIFNLDELPQAFLANQNIASQIVNEYRVGEHRIPLGITICCTGNKPSNKAGTTPMPSHLKDRLMFIPIEADHEDWLNWAAGNGIDPRVRAYIRNSPSKLHPTFEPGVQSHPSPRSWAKVSSILSMGMPIHIRTEAIKGTVGEGVATEFESYIRVADKMPSLDEILKHPEDEQKAPVFGPREADILYMLLTNLADVATSKNVGNVLKYLARLPNEEFQAFCVRDMLRRDKSLAKTKEMTLWLSTKAPDLLY